LATGRAQVGNLGSSSMKRFNTIGTPYPQAAALERLCKRYSADAQVLTHATAFTDAEHSPQAYLQVVDVVALPGTNEPQRIGVLRDRSGVKPKTKKDADHVEGDGEWLYEVDAGRKQNPFGCINQGFAAMADGKSSEAAALIAEGEAEASAANDAVQQLAVTTLKALVSGGEPTDLGPFWTECMHPMGTGH
jgi:hypothetical protein